MKENRRLNLKADMALVAGMGTSVLGGAANAHPAIWVVRFLSGLVGRGGAGRAAFGGSAAASTSSVARAGMISTRSAGLSIGGKYALLSASAYSLFINYNPQAVLVQGDLNLTIIETLNQHATNSGNVVIQAFDRVSGAIQWEEPRSLALGVHSFQVQVPDLSEGIKSILIKTKQQTFKSAEFLTIARSSIAWE